MWSRRDKARYELLDDLSRAFFGKQTYFDEPDGRVFSRIEQDYLSLDMAIAEFRERLYYS